MGPERGNHNGIDRPHRGTRAMAVTVKLFAQLRERLGRNEATVDAVEAPTVAAVWTQLTGETALPSHVLAAVNLEYADGATSVGDGDEVAFFPPVTGG